MRSVTRRKVSVFGVFLVPYFAAFVLNTERYGVSLRIWSECGQIRTRKTPTTDTFHAVNVTVVTEDLIVPSDVKYLCVCPMNKFYQGSRP